MGSVARTRTRHAGDKLARNKIARNKHRGVLGERAAQIEHGIRHGIDLLAERHEVAVSVGDYNLAGQQPGRVLIKQHGFGFMAQEQGVVAEQTTREGVVGRNGRRIKEIGGVAGEALAGRLGHERNRHQPGRGELADAPVDAFGEFSGRLAGEGEPEDLVGASVPIGEQPEYPVGHGLGLAAAGTGDDERRGERGLNDPLLFGGWRRHLQGRRNGEGRDRRPGRNGHELTCLMMWMRHAPNERGSRQWLAISAWNTAPPISVASSPTRVRKASSSSGVNTSCVGLR